MTTDFIPVDVIKKTREKIPLSKNEIDRFISGYLGNQVQDYQVAAWLMSVFLNGLTDEESHYLTDAMLNSGSKADLSGITQFKVDKHSTGGVGDKTSLILAPIVASLGFAVPMMSGRGLGHTGGTLDKLESIPGFDTQLSLETFQTNLKEHLLCFIGQTEEVCPADKKLYALRDVTATIESLPLICASIMSKKIAEGIDGLVLDVKFGSGAFMKTKEQALTLAQRLRSVAKFYNKKCSALLTNMNQPLGRFAGNALEVIECLEILKGRQDLAPDTYELSIQLAAHMLFLGKFRNPFEDCVSEARKAVTSGKALDKFLEITKLQKGRIEELPKARQSAEIFLPTSGFIKSMDVENIGMSMILLKAGRKTKGDFIDPTAGIEFLAKIGDHVDAHKPVARFFAKDQSLFEIARKKFITSYTLSDELTPPQDLIWKVINEFE